MWNYILYFYPMEDLFTNRIEIFSEITNLFLMYHVLCFTDFVYDPEMRYMIGYSFILFIGMFIATHLYFMMRGTIKDATTKHRTKLKKKRDKKQKEEAEKQKLDIFRGKANEAIAKILNEDDRVADNEWRLEL